MELYEIFCKLNAAHGPSGDEGGVRDAIRELAQPYADSVEADVMGNLIVRKRGKGAKLMLCAHMDSIGLVATHIDPEGFVRCGRLGGIRPADALYTPVRFRNGTRGAFVREDKAGLEKLNMDECLIDIGAKDRDGAQKLVRIGDTAVYDAPTVRNGSVMITPYADDRIACAVLLRALETAAEAANDVYFVFSTQEEVGLRGAKTAAYAIRPDYALALDVTDSCDTPKGEHLGTARLGGGAAVKLMDKSVICHPRMVALLEQLAEKQGIKTQRDLITVGGTDAGAIHTTGEGAITGGISIPCRYIHTPTEMIDLDDADECVRLTAALIGTPLERI